MRILVTNDDGVESPGLESLARALVGAGHDVFVVAPTSDRSGSSAAIGPIWRSGPIPVVEHVWSSLPGIPVSAIDAAPHARGVARLIGETSVLRVVDRAGWEPSYGRLAEAQARWEQAHGRPLVV